MAVQYRLGSIQIHFKCLLSPVWWIVGDIEIRLPIYDCQYRPARPDKRDLLWSLQWCKRVGRLVLRTQVTRHAAQQKQHFTLELVSSETTIACYAEQCRSELPTCHLFRWMEQMLPVTSETKFVGSYLAPSGWRTLLFMASIGNSNLELWDLHRQGWLLVSYFAYITYCLIGICYLFWLKHNPWALNWECCNHHIHFDRFKVQ